MAYRGKSLKALRETKLIRLQRIANETRIGLCYLEDLEEERFDRFPGEFYFQSFVKSYARSLDLDPDEIATDLQAAYEEWQGGGESPGEAISTPVDDGLFRRIAGYLWGAQEV